MGNILSQKRNGGGTSPTALDELTYNYHTTTDGLVSNRLYQVNDVVSAGNYTDDIDDQGTFNNTHSTIETANNYGYDELGNLVRDVQEEIASIEWTVYGKMKKITRTGASSKADLEFGYDASGNRLWKKVTPKGSGAVISTYYYLRDAQGNEMCRYVKYTNTTSQLMYVAQEHSIYGSSRVGVDNRKDTLYLGAVYTPTWGGVGASRRELGLKSFELTNQLGNVLVTVSDKPVYKVSSTTIFFQPEISSISDYYPFGAPINERSFSSTEYRFGFNTQEKTDEISGPGNHNTATFWEYDTRLGRRWNQDPKPDASISNYSALGNNPIMFTDILGDTTNYYNSSTGKLLGTVYGSAKYGDRYLSEDAYNRTVANNKTSLNSAISEATKNMIDLKEIAAITKQLNSQFTNQLESGLNGISKTIDLGSKIGLLSRIGFAEFRGSESIEQQAGMDITLNRVGVKGFAKTLEGVITQPLQYSSLNNGDPNKPFYSNPYGQMYAKDNRGNKVFSLANHNAWTRTVENAWSIAHRTASMTQGATLYYSPLSMRPRGSKPKWNFDILQEVFVPGVDPNHIKMYRNK
jgi:RHS repeat-associated protein